jgi:hypothetical protein
MAVLWSDRFLQQGSRMVGGGCVSWLKARKFRAQIVGREKKKIHTYALKLVLHRTSEVYVF